MLDVQARLQRHAAQLDGLAPVIDLREAQALAASTPAHELRVPLRVSHRWAVIALAVLALGLIAAAVGYGLRSETVEEGPRLGTLLEMRIAPDGLPFLTYSDEQTGDTVFAKCTDPFCADEPAFTRFEGAFPEVWMRDDGRPLIWIEGPDGSGTGPWVLDCADPACADYDVTSTPVRPTRVLGISPDGPTLVMFDGSLGSTVGICADWACSTGVTDIGLPAGDPDLTAGFLDASSRPVVVLVDGSDLHLLRCRGDDCSNGFDDSIVATGDLEELRPFAAVADEHDIPWIVHGRYELTVVRCGDPVCSTSESTALGDGERAWRVSALVGFDGLPLFVYNWSPPGDADVLEVARCGDGGCRRGTVATISSGSSIGSFEAVIGDDGYPVIAHRSTSGVALSDCGDPGCTDGALEVVTWDHTETATTTTTSPTPSSIATDATTGTTTPGYEPGWTELGPFEDAFGPGAHINALVGRGDEIVAVGTRCDGSACRPTSWSTGDGRSWQMRTIGEVGEPTHIVEGPGGLVVVGLVCDEADGCEAPGGEPARRRTLAVWRSGDGVTWDRADLHGCGAEEARYPCAATPWRVAGGPSGYLIAALDLDRPQTAVWASTDGGTWFIADLGLDDYDEAGDSAVWSTSAGMVVMVRVGSYTADGFSIESRLWSSGDASTWIERDASVIGAQWGAFEAMTWLGGTLLSAQEWQGDSTATPTLYLSPDGLDWTVYEWTDLIGGRPATAITPYAGGLFGAGVEFDVLEGRNRAYTWTSADGVTWRQEEWPLDEFPFPEGSFRMAALGSGVLLVGDSGIVAWYPDD